MPNVKKRTKEYKDADTRKYPVIEQTYFFNLDNTGDIEDDIKIKFWWSEDREVLLHCQHYPYENISTEVCTYLYEPYAVLSFLARCHVHCLRPF